MNWSKLNFGKHEGKTLPQVLYNDPDWFYWSIKMKIFTKRTFYHDDLSMLLTRSRKIRIPNNFDGNLVVDYFTDEQTGKFSYFRIVDSTRVPRSRTNPEMRLPVLDMLVPYRLAAYDKGGYKEFKKCFRYYYFGSKTARASKEKIETFFADKSNFALEPVSIFESLGR
jgi:hypothetical protein